MAETYQWTGRNIRGAIESGEMLASSSEDVRKSLRKDNIVPTTIRIKRVSSGIGFFQEKVKEKDIVVFTRLLSTMLNAGLPLIQSLNILSDQVENRSLARIILELKLDIEGGSTFNDALRKHPKVFSELYINMVTAAEASGTLDTILDRLALYVEQSRSLKKKISGAMIYPTVLFSISMMLLVIMLVFIVPSFASLFKSMGKELPLLTRVTVEASNFVLGSGGGIILAAVVTFALLLIQVRRTEKGRYITDKILLSLPVLGMLLRKTSIAQFTRTFGTLITSGVQILEALDITSRTTGNRVIERSVSEASSSILQGKPLSEPLMANKDIPPLVSHLISVGETSGELDKMLGKIADYYENEVNMTVANLASLMEPFVILFIGGIISFFVVSMYLPIFRIPTLYM